MNKEAKELIEEIKVFNIEHSHHPYYLYTLDKKDVELLLDYINQLETKINTYENPEDMTLMFMWCDEKAKDKIKELKQKVNQLEDKLNKINAIVSNIDEKKIPKYQNKIRDIKFYLEYDFWANQKVKRDNDMSSKELEIHNILLNKIEKDGEFNE